MLRNLLRATGVVLGLLVSALVFTTTSVIQADYPFGTTTSVTLSSQSAPADKTSMVSALDSLARKTGVTIYKPVADATDPTHGRDVIVLGADRSGSVQWFARSYHGHYITAAQVTTQPFDGRYLLTSCGTQCRTALDEWASSTGVEATWASRSSTVGMTLGSWGNTGAGLALVGALILSLSAALAWFTSHERSRAIRLVGGVRRWRITAQDLTTLCGLLVLPAAAALVVGLAGLAIWAGTVSVVTAMLPVLIVVVVVIALMLAVSLWVLSGLFAADWRIFRDRQTRHGHATFVGLVLRVSTVIMVAVALPLAVSNTTSAATSARQQEVWGRVSDAYSPIFSQQLQTGDQDAVKTAFTKLGTTMDPDRVLFSWALSGMMELTGTQRGGYDDLVLTNPAFLTAFNDAPLTEVDASSLPAQTRSLIEDSLRTWSADGSLPAYHLMRATDPGSAVIPVLTSGIRTGSGTTMSNPLLIVLDDPATELSPDGMLLPALVNGNLVYRGYDQLMGALTASGVISYYSGVDNATSLVVQNAQDLRREAALGAVGIVLAVGAVAASLVQGAMAWAARRREQIFLARTAGNACLRLATPPAAAEALLAVIAALVMGALLTNSGGGVAPGAVAAILVAFIVVYAVLALAAYTWQARSAVAATTGRNL